MSSVGKHGKLANKDAILTENNSALGASYERIAELRGHQDSEYGTRKVNMLASNTNSALRMGDFDEFRSQNNSIMYFDNKNVDISATLQHATSLEKHIVKKLNR